MRYLLIAALAAVLAPAPALASTTVLGDYTMACYEHEDAREYASKPSYDKIEKELGCDDWEEAGDGVADCKPCGNGEYRCQGYVEAYCE